MIDELVRKEYINEYTHTHTYIYIYKNKGKE